ncbi:hypothetical protein [Oceanobacillus sp. CFH 90083]|nr:hypothetical protein [Oceanobacillus sp. CFH 90083]
MEAFRNWQKEIMNSFAFGLHNAYVEESIIKPRLSSVMHSFT